MIKPELFKDSNDFANKKVLVTTTDNEDGFVCTIISIEKDGLLVYYYTDEDDIHSICDEDDDDATLVIEYYTWDKINSIRYKKDEKYE